VRYDKEFMLYGGAIEKEKSKNGPSWRARVAKLLSEWLNGVRQTSNKVHQTGPWDEHDLLNLDQLANRQLEEDGSIKYRDWKKISKQFDGRDADQCKYQYFQRVL
jgi:hypothetical protein